MAEFTSHVPEILRPFPLHGQYKRPPLIEQADFGYPYDCAQQFPEIGGGGQWKRSRRSPEITDLIKSQICKLVVRLGGNHSAVQNHIENESGDVGGVASSGATEEEATHAHIVPSVYISPRQLP
jgi:hypothetical protein